MKDKYRLFSIILYEESEDYNIRDCLFNIRASKYYAYILHNKDTNNKGEFKKPHYHVIIRLDNACTIKALAKKIGIKENYIQHIRNERAYIRYLIHFDDIDKYQYALEEIVSSRSYDRKIKKSFEDFETEEEIICKINSFIESLHGKDKSSALFLLIQYVNSNCYDTIYKRYRQEFTNLLAINL